MRRLDSHTHLDLWPQDDPRLHLARAHPVGIVAWAWFPDPPQDLAGVVSALQRQARVCASCRGQGLEVWRMVGLHPRSIPTQGVGPELVPHLRAHLAEHADALGIGEVGLETGSPREVRVLEDQLDLALSLGLPCGLHTPRRDKERVFGLLSEVLRAHDLRGARVVVDHVDSVRMLDAVLDLGCWAGITVSPTKSSPAQALAMLRARPQAWERIMVDTDGGSGDTAADYQAYLDLEEALGAEAAVLGRTARTFLGI